MINIDIRKHEKLSDDYSAFITFSYNANIVNKIRSYPFRYYNPEMKSWEIPVENVTDFINSFQDTDIKITGEISQLNEKEVNTDIPEGFHFKTKPFKHQEKGLEYGLKYDRWFLGDEQGLGKTKQIIDIAVARKIKYGYEHCLIVCGVNTLKWNWMNEIHTHSDEECWILGQRKQKNGSLVIGSMTDKLNDLTDIDELPYFIITNVESFRNENFTEKIVKLCKSDKINMCAADETHKMKNPQSQQTKGFLKCLPKCRIAMTGTPLMNSPMDLYVILKWLGYENHAFYSFKQHYCVMGGYGGYEIVGYKNIDQLTNQINSIMLRRLKKDVLDLPEKIYVDEYVDMTPKQSDIYKEVQMDIKAHIDEIQFENNPLSTLIRLRQATGYTGILSSSIKESAKLDRLEDLVDEAVANNNKCLVFSNWTQMTDVIKDKLSRYNPAIITGETKDSERSVQQDKFMHDDSCKVIIGTIGAMGTGLTLTAGSVVIFVDEPWNKALFEQAVDRAHRIGTKNNVTIYSIMCKGTIDERIHDLIYKKGIMSDCIIDGKIVGNKTEILNYLLG